MLLKKYLIPIIITAVVLTALFGPFSAHISSARCCQGGEASGYLPVDVGDASCGGLPEVTCPAGGALVRTSDTANGGCNPFYNFNAGNCVLIIGANIAQYAIWTPANLFLALGGMAMDTSISLTINGSIFSGLANEQNGVVAAGWGLSRDIINIFLIFILLYIAIATILQVSGYGAKELLATLIIIAFLVNFSLVITKIVIDASNVLAVGFYNAFSPVNGQVQISQSFKQAFDLENIVKQVDAVKNSDNLKNLYLVQFLTYLLGAGIAAIAGFIFMVFAILFAIRMVVLLILMILAPLAFGAMILPSTKAHAKKWWHTLFSQAFFAPAGLFMLWLSAKMATSMHSLFQNVLGVGNAGLADMLIDAQTKDANWENIAKFVLQFVIIAIILIAAIIVAKQMGAMGAESAIKGVTKGLRKAQGYAGRIGRRVTAQAGGPLAERVLEGKGGAAAFVRSIPLATRGLAGLSAMEEKRKMEKQKRYEKAYGTYSEAGLEAMRKTPIITPTKRRAIEKVLEEKKEKREAKAEKAAAKADYEKAVKSGNPMEIMMATARLQTSILKGISETEREELMAIKEGTRAAKEETKAAKEETTATKTKAEVKF